MELLTAYGTRLLLKKKSIRRTKQKCRVRRQISSAVFTRRTFHDGAATHAKCCRFMLRFLLPERSFFFPIKVAHSRRQQVRRDSCNNSGGSSINASATNTSRRRHLRLVYKRCTSQPTFGRSKITTQIGHFVATTLRNQTWARRWLKTIPVTREYCFAFYSPLWQ